MMSGKIVVVQVTGLSTKFEISTSSRLIPQKHESIFNKINNVLLRYIIKKI